MKATTPNALKVFTNKPLLSAPQVIARLMLIISISELLIMWFLETTPSHLRPFSESLLDAALLTAISTPLVYLWVINPFVRIRDRALNQLNEAAHTDPLTKLANRRFLSTHLEKPAVPSSSYQAMLLIDLDGFKPINDTHGHAAGDAILVEVARRLRASVRAEDIVVRMGGDEFLLLLNGLGPNPERAREKTRNIAEQLLALIQQPVPFQEKVIKVSASIGARLLNGIQTSPEKAILETDSALFRAKEAGRGRVIFFDK
jgi:two-component system, cell cycle response regulator